MNESYKKTLEKIHLDSRSPHNSMYYQNVTESTKSSNEITKSIDQRRPPKPTVTL